MTADWPHREKSAAAPLALCWVALIAYASLFPFTGWRNQGLMPWVYLSEALPQYWTRFDVLANFAGYAPLGLLLALAWSASGRLPPGLAALLATLAAAALSLTLEALQTYLPLRIASNLDLALNAAGATAGALAALVLEKTGLRGRWRSFRRRWFAPDSRGALVLLALWPVALLYPTPVAFGLGHVYERAEAALAALLKGTPWLEWLPLRELELQPLLPDTQVLCVALGAVAPCLLGYGVMQGAAHRALFALLAMVTGVGTLALSFALTWGPVAAWGWLHAPQMQGLAGCVCIALLALPLPRRICLALLVAALLAQLSFLNAAPLSAYDLENLQRWEQGRFIHFYGLAQWVGWLWPFVVLAFLALRAMRLISDWTKKRARGHAQSQVRKRAGHTLSPAA